MASKPPSKGISNQELPSELVIPTVRQSPLHCGYDEWKASMTLENDKSSHDLKRGIHSKNARLDRHETQLPSSEDKKKQIPSTPSDGSSSQPQN